MATAYKSPGVYVKEIAKFPPSVAAVETAIPAFVGYTQTAIDLVTDDLLLKPFRITSMKEYELHFGFPEKEAAITVSAIETRDADGKTTALTFEAHPNPSTLSVHIMHYAMRMFFDNGGGPCYIVAVALYKTPLLDELKAGLTALEKVDEPTLLVFPEAQSLKIADFKALHDAALAQCELLKDRFVIMDVHGGDADSTAPAASVSLSDPKTKLLKAVETFRHDGIGSENLKYGAAYAPNLETVLDFVIDEAKIEVSHVVNAGTAVKKVLGTLKLKENALYEGALAVIRDLPCKLPPSSAMAGIYAANDNERGVWKAPANRGINNVIKPTIEFTERDMGDMYVDPTGGKSVNAILYRTGEGTKVFGARTLAGNDSEWRCINVRRFFIFVEESLKKAINRFMFEANDAKTWVQVRAASESFLNVQWRQGAMYGVKPEHAYYVAVGLGKTMTAVDLLDGRMIVEIGIAAVRPAEYIVLYFSHMMPES